MVGYVGMQQNSMHILTRIRTFAAERLGKVYLASRNMSSDYLRRFSHFDIARSCVQGILDELLDCSRDVQYDLTGADSVHDFLIDGCNFTASHVDSR